jgi:hypothetical protein
MVLSGAILAGAGVIAYAITAAASKFDVGGGAAMGAGAILGVIGLFVLASGFRSDTVAKL